jgi:hypothetical protein
MAQAVEHLPREFKPKYKKKKKKKIKSQIWWYIAIIPTLESRTEPLLAPGPPP